MKLIGLWFSGNYDPMSDPNRYAEPFKSLQQARRALGIRYHSHMYGLTGLDSEIWIYYASSPESYPDKPAFRVFFTEHGQTRVEKVKAKE